MIYDTYALCASYILLQTLHLNTYFRITKKYTASVFNQ
ncbi:hypothetical protein PTUN_b0502 [Pseudoalteromonas tunicata]|nr:hypothetical protein PTUN_b0502 [Pseudoalteromonas tunicata]